MFNQWAGGPEQGGVDGRLWDRDGKQGKVPEGLSPLSLALGTLEMDLLCYIRDPAWRGRRLMEEGRASSDPVKPATLALHYHSPRVVCGLFPQTLALHGIGSLGLCHGPPVGIFPPRPP